MHRIALDAMGGDHAPETEVDGAIAAVRERAVEVVLVGDEPRLRKLMDAASSKSGAVAGPGRLTVRNATQVIGMDDQPGSAFKTKKDSSMRVCFNLVTAGEADAVVSAGNSGAMLAGGLLLMKRVPHLERPAIVTVSPMPGRQCVALDVGANTDVKPSQLVQFAVLGSAYAKLMLGRARPRVGVLSNGEEESKGTDLTREAHRLLSAAAPGFAPDFEFLGYAEGRDFFTGKFDVIVTDGFTGNVALKTSEGTMRMIFDLLETEIRRRTLSGLGAKLGFLLLKPAFRALKRILDPDESGGAPLLGVNGVAVLCHGSSGAKAIKNAIFMAERFLHASLAPALAEAIARHRPLWSEGQNPPARSAEA